MDCISVFDMLKIGVGPSSSHTLGPWRAAEAFLKELEAASIFDKISRVRVDLYGSLSLTGKGHATDYAVMLGLSGADPEYIPIDDISSIINTINETEQLNFGNKFLVNFQPKTDIVFNREFLPFHANGLTFTAYYESEEYSSTFYSVGGGFFTKEDDLSSSSDITCAFPFLFNTSTELLAFCDQENKTISEIMFENEKTIRTEDEISHELKRIWETMLECMYIGCHTEGILPGGLNVKRRAFEMHNNLKGSTPYSTPQEWITSIRKTKVYFRQILKWVSCFALAVNEVNASLGRVVTAPTNGSAGVIPAVLMYYLVIENHKGGQKEIEQFLTTAGVIGSIFKKGATISAAMGGCQAEIG
ncbi:L-serine ammonia-lyase, partial [Algoriella sp.]|uniref:L-serine ammonia-lyase n=1 Tax=Algoriella sp. TaxID=1872434 RepID=UPI001B228FBC